MCVCFARGFWCSVSRAHAHTHVFRLLPGHNTLRHRRMHREIEYTNDLITRLLSVANEAPLRHCRHCRATATASTLVTMCVEPLRVCAHHMLEMHLMCNSSIRRAHAHARTEREAYHINNNYNARIHANLGAGHHHHNDVPQKTKKRTRAHAHKHNELIYYMR